MKNALQMRTFKESQGAPWRYRPVQQPGCEEAVGGGESRKPAAARFVEGTAGEVGAKPGWCRAKEEKTCFINEGCRLRNP